MSIKHSFSSGKADDADATLVNPSDWNAAHDPALTTKGDIIARSGSAAARLGVGSNDEALIADSAQTLGLKYAAVILASLLTTRGDIIFRNATVPARLAKGTSGFVLKQGANDPAWAIDPAQDLVTTAGDILFATAADTLARLGIGAAGAILQVNSGATAPEYLALGTAEQVLRVNSGATALEYATHFAPKIVIKGSDESVTSSAILQDDDALLFAVAANEKWVFDLFISYRGDPAGDIKIAFTAPSAASFRWMGHGLDLAATITRDKSEHIVQTNDDSAGTFGCVTGTDVGVHLKGTIENGANAGNLQLRWAQRVSDTTATTIHARSHLVAHRLS